jgi:hypothetical protein
LRRREFLHALTLAAASGATLRSGLTEAQAAAVRQIQGQTTILSRVRESRFAMSGKPPCRKRGLSLIS